MSAVLVTLILCGSGLWLWHRAEPRLDKWLDHRVMPPPAAPKDAELDPMPSDLLMSAMSFSDEWAREQAIDRLKELRGEYGSWDRVRMAAGSVLGREVS